MPYRIYQGKEVITSDALILPRGQLFVDLNTLDTYVGDGATPGGVPISVSGGTPTSTSVDGGSAATVFTPDETLDGGGA